ncbi:hypothetical protein ACFQ49_01945 [Kroppenstedtia eburnea]|uniref:Uncharacterized protein n=1 Tax=Kroppenstedtia eburnea TaxID=714067 RepID=A0A1N7KUB9_9BACL|nr:hypothetical protein [Kroppenstedtia eburnea]EGK12388.1 hypothetical protein HMPREF9374_1455 [Desmospora sp. 8437]QKI82807.1 hypothetical protein GXN75_12830 [Kroppenstedtia eburnea]SIS65154.1 hypothetical protein SAMN05421790_103273 [Kroppenstedtia eburnea]
MFGNIIKRLLGKQVRIHSHVVKPLNHQGIYEYHEYLRYLIREERRKQLPPMEWQEEKRGA